MKRRGFLGLFGAAAVSGPSIAKSAIAELPSGLGASGARLTSMSSPCPSYASSVASHAAGGQWELSEIDRIRKWLSGERAKEERASEERRRIENRRVLVEQNIACLRSTSGVTKMRMFAEAEYAVELEAERKGTEDYLARLLRDVAGLK